MPKIPQKTLWLLATTLFGLGIAIVFLSYIFTEPWHCIPEVGGDGSKNILSYMYHCMYGSGYWFEGMNYPYGDHIVFTDGVPLVSVFLASIGNVSGPASLTVLWLLLGLSYILSVVYVYKTLLRFGVAPAAAMLFAGMIVVLTPQMLRLKGHYALAFTCIIPMLFYWSVVYQQTGKLKNCVYIFLMGSVVSFVHPYFAGIILIWVVAYAAGYMLLDRHELKMKAKHVGGLIVAGGAIPAVVMTVMKLTDPLTDRPATPFNPLETYTDVMQVITSYFSPFWKFAVERLHLPKAANGGEGFTYIGLVPMAVLLLVIPVGLLLHRQSVPKTETEDATSFSPVWLFMAFGALAFSMGFPFKLNIPGLMDYLFLFKQFRALGRFAWIFYYIVAVYGAVMVYRWYGLLRAAGRPALAWGLLIMSMAVWSFEGKGYIRESRRIANAARYNYDLVFSVHEQTWPEFLKEHNRSADDFQALLLLKFFHVGTDKIWIGEPGWLITLGAKAALQLHLPIIDLMAARASWEVAQKQVKIAGGPFTEKSILADIKSNKPFLLMDHDLDSLSPDERYLLNGAEYIGEFTECRIYACYPERLSANDDSARAYVREQMTGMAVGDTCIGCNDTWYINHLDGNKGNSIWGSGAMTRIGQRDSVFASIPVHVQGDSVMYEYSAWFLLGNENYRSPKISLSLKDEKGEELKKVIVNAYESTDSYGLWFRASKYLYIDSRCREITCQLINDPAPSYKLMDEVLLRPARALVISKGADGQVMVNNHRFKEGAK